MMAGLGAVVNNGLDEPTVTAIETLALAESRTTTVAEPPETPVTRTCVPAALTTAVATLELLVLAL